MTPASNSEGAHSIEVNCDSSESTIGINIKTLDSQTYSLRVNKNIPVPALKEKIVTTIGVPPEQQRLIYRGKVLKDEQLLSELHMEDGDTLHLVVRQPVQSQPTSSTGATEASRVSSSQANDSGSGVQRNRVGQVAHSILLGTVNVADRPGEAMLADLSRSIEAFLSSLGLVTVEPTGGPSRGPSVSALNQASSGAGAERSQDASRTEPGNSAHEGFMPSNSPLLASTQFSQLPFVRTLNQQMVIPDALTTLSEFINRMELVLQSGSSSLNNAQHQQHPEASSLDARGLPTPEFLCYVMERAQQLLRDNATSALLNVSTRLQREGSSSDPVLRGQIQTEAMQLGVAMQHLGAMLLELGRTIMTLRMGQSPAESSVNAGPAVYISPTGPNPIMVQPSSLFGISSHPLVSGLSVGASPGNPLNNINVQLHTGSSIAPGVSSTGSMPNPAEAISGERPNTEQTSAGINVSNDSISTRGLPLRTVISATPARTVPEATGHVLSVTYPVHIRAQHSIPIHFASSQGAGSTLSGGGQPHEQTSVLPPSDSVPTLPPSDSVPTLPPSDSVPTFVAQITARIANALTGNAQVQSSSASMQTIATQGSHSVVASGTQSDLSNSTLQPPQMNSSIVHTAPSIMQSSLLCSDSQSQNPLSRHQTSQGSNSREENELACPEDLFSGNDGAKSDSLNVGGTEHMKQIGPGECHTSDLSGSGKEAKQLEGNQFGCVGSGFSVEETSATSSSNIPADCHPTCIQSSSSDIESSKREPDSVDFCKPTSSNSPIESNMPTPLGLGFGGLQPKKRSKPVKPKVEDDVQAVASSSDQSQHSIASVREALCSLPSQTTNVDRGNNANGSSSQHPSLISQFMNSMPSGGQGGSGQTDFAGMIANAMQSSAFNNLLTGVASQSTVSTGDLRSMLEQCVQSPAVQNTVNQLVQQVGQSQDNGNIQGTGQNRLNFTGMIQQMLPVVSQALGRASTRSALVQDMQSGPQPESNDAEICAVESLHDVNHQLDLSQALEKIEQHGDPRSIFGTLLEIAGHLYGEGNFYQDIVDLGNDEELANEFMEVLKRDIIRRLEEESISENKS